MYIYFVVDKLLCVLIKQMISQMVALKLII